MRIKLVRIALSATLALGGGAGLGHAHGQAFSSNLSPGAKLVPLPQSRASAASRTNAPASFVLKPTPIAPVGAAGSAELKGNTLAVHLNQIGPGKYEVQAVSHSGRTGRLLGTITIVDPTLSPSRQATDNRKEASAHPESVLVTTDASMSLPRDLARRDIAGIQVLSDGGNVVLDSLAK